MILDILFVILLILAVIKGYRRGLILGVFSLLAIIVGLAAAMKLSTLVAGYLGEAVSISERWLPVISFLVVFLGVILLVRLAAGALEKTVEAITLGWLNKLGGILFYLVIYITVFSVMLFYAGQIRLIRPGMIEDSATYSFIQPWGPRAINALATVLPFFRDMFTELEQFFAAVSERHAAQ